MDGSQIMFRKCERDDIQHSSGLKGQGMRGEIVRERGMGERKISSRTENVERHLDMKLYRLREKQVIGENKKYLIYKKMLVTFLQEDNI